MSPSLRASVRRILFAASVVAASAVVAEPQSASTEIEEVVIVTGSYIKGTAEDAALPVDVITAGDLQKQGSPSMVNLIKSIPAIQAVLGEANQFGALNASGTSTANLRGLGATRTLILLNGRRLAGSPTGIGVDTNLLPSAAIGRIEVLKDGAAATYGSDAIGGVINFITKENAQGLSIDGSYSYIDGSDGDYDTNVSYGWEAGSSKGLIAAGYRHRSQLSTLDRDWAVRPFSESPEGGWSGFSNPGVFSVSAAAATAAGLPSGAIVDPACAALGGTVSGGCRFQYTAYDNLIEDEDHYQVFADYNLDISDTVTFHAEALYGMHDVPHEYWSPSYGPNQGPAGGAPTYFVPLASPGLQALLSNASSGLTAAQRNAINASLVAGQPGVTVSGLSWRPLAQGGNPDTGFAQHSSRKFDSFRVSAGFNGEFGGGISWDTAATYMENTSDISTPDFLVSRLGLALRGLGGPACTGTTPGASGCLWLNPFSSGVPVNLATGDQNTQTFTPGTQVSADLVRWLTTPNSYEATTTLLVVDAVLSGQLGFSLPGGNVGWAFGGQYRDDGFKRDVTDGFANVALNPCADTPLTGNVSCASPNGALSFYGPLKNTDVSRDMFAAFGELSAPITDSLQAQLALRYESYGGGVGSTTNPKLSLRWQAVDWLALRGSVGTTFRAPTPVNLDPSATTNLVFTAQAGGYKPYDTFGNADLKPETADTFNVGFIVNAGNFGATVDYFNFKFQDQLTTEVGTQLVTALYSPYVDAGGVARANHCADTDPRYAALRGRFTFGGTGCDSGSAAAPAFNLLRTRVNQLNAQADVQLSGIDASMHYLFSDVLGGDLTLGVDATYNIEYKIGATLVEGIQVDPAQDLIGTRGGRGNSLPQWRGAAYLDLGTGIHNIRWTTRYIDSMEDVRIATFATNPSGQTVDSFITHDLTYRAELPWETTVNVSVFNVFDEDPSFARLDLNYDPFIANPLGRYFKVGVTKKF